MEGTASLLSRGIARQEPQNQSRWISLASSLLDANVEVAPTQQAERKVFSVKPLGSDAESDSEKYVATYQALHSSQQLTLEFEGVTEHILTATAFFMLNELGRLPAEQRQKAFDEMRSAFNYDVLRVQQGDLELDSRQQSRLQNGDTVVALKRQLGQGSTFNVYAPWGKTDDALVLGPIGFFNPFPTYIAATVLGSALLILAVMLMLIIRKLGNRLVALQEKVDSISPEAVAAPKEEDDQEVITALSTKIQNMAQRIEKLLDEKAYMIRAVSHDLRTPIAKLHFRLEALTDKLSDDNKLIRGCHDDLRQLNLLIDELLTYEKLSVKQSIEFKPLDIHKIVCDQADGLGVVYPNIDIKVTATDKQKAQIEGNEVLLRRLFENLLHNAGRHATKQISAQIKTRADNLEIIIDDDGEGLKEELIPHLFEPFFRADESRTAAKGGYGLGLAIVKQVVMQHNAEVIAANNALGGAQFKLTFPVRQTSHD